MLAHLLLVALPFAAGLSVHRSSVGLPAFNTSGSSNILQLRQDKTKDPVCTPPCTAEGCSVCDAGSSLLRRGHGTPAPGWNPALEFHSFLNATAQEGDLHKRLFTYTPGSTNPAHYASYEPTHDEVQNYVLGALAGNDAVNYGGRQGLMWARGGQGDERAVAKQREFKDKPFQIITRGVYGCTVLVLVSQRAVWMTHLWEIYSSGQGYDNLGADFYGDPAFHDRVIKFMKGEPVVRAAHSFAPYQPRPYVPPSGPGIKANLFNSLLRDQTELFIFTPVRQPFTMLGEYSVDMIAENINQPNHYGPAGEVVNAVQGILGFMPRINMVPYTRLDMTKPEERAMLQTSIRGTVTFQYDPNSDGRGKKAWRLFMEARRRYQDIGSWEPQNPGGSA